MKRAAVSVPSVRDVVSEFEVEGLLALQMTSLKASKHDDQVADVALDIASRAVVSSLFRSPIVAALGCKAPKQRAAAEERFEVATELFGDVLVKLGEELTLAASPLPRRTRAMKLNDGSGHSSSSSRPRASLSSALRALRLCHGFSPRIVSMLGHAPSKRHPWSSM